MQSDQFVKITSYVPPDYFTVETTPSKTIILDNISEKKEVYKERHRCFANARMRHGTLCLMLRERRFYRRNLHRGEMWGSPRYYLKKGKLRFREKPDGKLMSFVETL